MTEQLVCKLSKAGRLHLKRADDRRGVYLDGPVMRGAAWGTEPIVFKCRTCARVAGPSVNVIEVPGVNA